MKKIKQTKRLEAMNNKKPFGLLLFVLFCALFLNAQNAFSKDRKITGTVSFGKETKGKRRLVITPKDTSELPEGSDHYEVLIPKWRHMTVFEGENVDGHHRVQNRGDQKQVGDGQAGGSQDQHGHDGRSHHEQCVQDIEPGDDARAMSRRRPGLHQRVERNNIKPAKSTDHHQVEHDAPVGSSGDEPDDRDAGGRCCRRSEIEIQPE